MACACGYEGNFLRQGYLDGKCLFIFICSVSAYVCAGACVTGLTVAVSAPRVNRSVCSKSKSVVISGVYCNNIVKERRTLRVLNADRVVGAVCCTVTELAIGIVTPRPYCTVIHKRDMEVAAGFNCRYGKF